MTRVKLKTDKTMTMIVTFLNVTNLLKNNEDRKYIKYKRASIIIVTITTVIFYLVKIYIALQSLL